MTDQLVNPRFPRSSKYNPEWMLEGPFGGNAVWLAEWLSESLELEPGMRVLDLGCGRAKSSVFLANEFDVQVWATDLWINPTENQQRIEAAHFNDQVFPIHADARALPFAAEFFDAIVCVDAYSYFGTDDMYLNYLAQFVKPHGPIGIAGAGLVREFKSGVPSHLERFWSQSCWCLHTSDWWKNHWDRTGVVSVNVAETMPRGIDVWKQWNGAMQDPVQWFVDTLDEDDGQYLGYVRMVASRYEDVKLEEYCWPNQSTTWPVEFIRHHVFRSQTPN